MRFKVGDYVKISKKTQEVIINSLGSGVFDDCFDTNNLCEIERIINQIFTIRHIDNCDDFPIDIAGINFEGGILFNENELRLYKRKDA